MADPDRLERLYTPHRMRYVRTAEPSDIGCPFCRMVDELPGEGLVVARGKETFAVLNLYPYNPGHLMVLPTRHVADYTELTPGETVELAEMTQQAVAAIRAISSPHAFNIGINLGSVAGGSLAAHLHQHVVPRWSGDANFLTVVAGTKTLPQLLEETRDLLAEAWRELS